MSLSTKSFRAGRLRHRVTLEQKSLTPDGMGGNTVSWTTVASSVPASIEPVSGRELFESEQVQKRTTHNITLRYDGSNLPTTEMRIVFESRNFYIQSVVNPEERDQWLVLKTEERDAE